MERENIVRKARFPRVQTIAQYQESKREIRRFLARNSADVSDLEAVRDQLTALHDSETNEHVRLRYRLDRDCLQAFINQHKTYKLDRFQTVDAPADLSMVIEKVAVRTRLDAAIQWADR